MAKEVARLDLNPLIHDAVANQIDIDKFNGIEDGATADQTASEIESLYEGLDNTNKYTDSDKSLVASALQSETVTSLSIDSNVLTYTDEKGNSTDIDLSLYLDDTNLARLTSGSLDADTGIATFKRDDNSTFTIDMSAFFDDTQVTVTDSLDSTSTTEALSANQGKIVNDALTNHKNDISNPHNVTQAQVGLSNVDNTADVNKPISTATQNALNLKRDITDSYSKTDLDNGQLDNRYYTEAEVLGAIGNINSPLLDLPLQNSLAMNKGVGSVTFSRSTTATYIDRYGILKTAAVDEPRFEKDGLLIEGSSTNLLTYGDEFDNAAWLKARCSISINSTTAPDGTTTADKLIDTADNNTHILYRDVTVPVGTSTMSIYVKSAEHTKCQVRAYNSTDGYTTANVDIALGITDSGDIAALGDGWYRVSLPKTTTVTTFSFRIYIVDSNGNNVYAGNGTDGIYIWGSQLEALPFASSYIPTTTSAVTRGGDVCKITRYNNSNSSFGDATTHIKFKYKGSNASSTLGWLLRDGSPMYSAFIRDTGYGSLREGSISNEYIIPFNETTSLTTTNNNSNISLYKNGILESTDTGLRPSAGESFIYVGSDQAGNGSMYGHISHIIKYQLALTATEVALLG